jgi:ComF family protein
MPSHNGLDVASLPAFRRLKRAVRRVLNLVVPMSCAACGREGSPLCERCEHDMPALKRPFCSRCAEPNSPLICRRCAETRPAFDQVLAPYLAQGAARELVHRLKYNDARAYSERIAGLLEEFLRRESISGDVIVPVPLHPSRERRRGYNQSALIARDLGRLTGIEVDSRSLRRVTKSVPQVTLSGADERRAAVEAAFECEPVSVGTVVLVDDVVTTGATMSECAKALKRGGAGRVVGVAFTRQSLGRT